MEGAVVSSSFCIVKFAFVAITNANFRQKWKVNLT